MFAQNQVAKFNQEESKLLKLEMQKLKEQQKKKDDQIRKLMYDNEEKWRIKE